jgi:hypothetical protein
VLRSSEIEGCFLKYYRLCVAMRCSLFLGDG